MSTDYFTDPRLLAIKNILDDGPHADADEAQTGTLPREPARMWGRTQPRHDNEPFPTCGHRLDLRTPSAGALLSHAARRNPPMPQLQRAPLEQPLPACLQGRRNGPRARGIEHEKIRLE